MIEPRSVQSQRLSMLAPLTTRPRQHTCMHDENQLLKSCIKLRYRVSCVCHKVRDVATPKMQVHNFMQTYHISKVQVSSYGGVRVFVKFAFKK